MQHLTLPTFVTLYDNYLDAESCADIERMPEYKDLMTRYWTYKTWKNYGIKNGSKELYNFLSTKRNPTQALESAAEFKLNNFANLIVEAGYASSVALKSACFNNNVELVRALLKSKRVNPAIDNNYCIKFASEFGHQEIVKMLLNEPTVNPAAEDNKAIIFAARHGRLSVIKLLMTDRRVNCKARNQEALKQAKDRKQWDVVEYLEQHCH